MDIIWWIIVGLIAGFLTGKLMRGSGFGASKQGPQGQKALSDTLKTRVGNVACDVFFHVSVGGAYTGNARRQGPGSSRSLKRALVQCSRPAVICGAPGIGVFEKRSEGRGCGIRFVRVINSGVVTRIADNDVLHRQSGVPSMWLDVLCIASHSIRKDAAS